MCFFCTYLYNLFAEMIIFKQNMFIFVELFLCNLLNIFKNKKKLRANQPTYLPTYLPTYRPTDRWTNRPTDRQTDQRTNQPTDQPTDRQTNWPTDQLTDQPTDRPNDWPTYLPTYLNINLLLFLPLCLPACLSHNFVLTQRQISLDPPQKTLHNITTIKLIQKICNLPHHECRL